MATSSSPKAPAPRRRAYETEAHVATVTRWSLVALAGPWEGTRYPIGEQTTVGRSRSMDLPMAHESLSRRHCMLTTAGEGLFAVSDLDSRNGTFVNGVRVGEQPVTLHPGDKLRIGTEVVLTLVASDVVEDALLQRQRLEMVGRLTTGVVHDLNNMLGAVAAAADHLQTLSPEERTTEEAAECVDDIVAATARAGDLASRLVAVARDQQARAPISLRTVCEDAVRIATRTFGGRIDLTSELEASPTIDADATQLLQVVLNLLLNARDAVQMAQRRNILIRLTEEREAGRLLARLEVQDEGTGIPASIRDRIFDPFFSTKTSHVGCGVGLSVVREIVEAHGGNIDVTSIPGLGSGFRVDLPAVATERRAKRQTARNLTGFGEHRIVVVDDEVVLRRGLARLLRRQGHEVIECDDGPAALEWIRDHPAPALVLLDFDLPTLHGAEVFRRMRRMGCQSPVVCISGHHDQGVAEEDGTSVPFLPKPFSALRLLDAVGTAVATSKAQPWSPDHCAAQ